MKGAYDHLRPFLLSSTRPRRLARPRTPPFHGDNTGSNPVGDANQFNSLEKSGASSSFLGNGSVVQALLFDTSLRTIQENGSRHFHRAAVALQVRHGK